MASVEIPLADVYRADIHVAPFAGASDQQYPFHILKALLCPGFPFSYGVFQDYYTNHPLFSSETSGIAIIGTSASGIMYLSAPLIVFALQAWPLCRRYSTTAGLAIVTL